MELYVLRHGIAEEAKPGAADADRALTLEGKKKLRAVLRVAKSAGMAPEAILSSPYRRAVETAQLAAEITGFSGAIEHSQAFTPMGNMEAAWEEIRARRQAAAILVCSHEPFTGLWIAFLLNAPSLQLDVKKGSITRIDVDSFGPRPRGVLRWILTPKLAAACR